MAATLPRPAVLPHSSGCQSCSASDRLPLQIISPSPAASTASGNNTTAGSGASITPTNNPPTPSGAESRPPPSPPKQQQQQHADSNMSQSVVLAHSRELEPHHSVATSMQDITWCPMQVSPQSEDDVTRSSPELLVALWPTTTRATTTSTNGCSRQPSQSVSISESIETPFIHMPRCKLSITSFDDLHQHQPLPVAGRGGPYPGHGSIKIEQVALPRAVVQTFLSGVRLPNGLAGIDAEVAFPRHFDDDDEWVQSRCILSDFSELEEEEAARLSSEERLCCWGSIVLTRDGHDGHEWDLGFVVHRVSTQRDPVTGTCACGRP